MNISPVTLLVGGSGGIGAELARLLAQRGHRLILAGRQPARLQSLADAINAAGGKADALTADIAGDAIGLADRARTISHDIDMLVNCAGMQTFGFSVDENATDTAQLIATNLTGPIQLVNALLPHMIERGSGRIVNVGSIFGSIGFPCFASYSASKFALRGYSEALRRELSSSGVRVTYVAPRYTRTAFNRDAVARMAETLGIGQDSAAEVARQILTAIDHDASDRYLGWPEKLFVRINAVLPRLVDRSLSQQAERMRPFALDASR